MQLKTITLSKKILLNMGNFSNVTAGMEMTFDIVEGEKPDYASIWGRINSELETQLATYKNHEQK